MVGWLVVLAGCTSACGGGDSDSSGSGSSEPGVAGATARDTALANGGESTVSRDSGRDCPALPIDDTGCTGEVLAGEAVPLDIYIMFDQSGSMSTPTTEGELTRIDVVRAALAEFLEDPSSNGIGVGIGFFGYHELGATSCDAADFSSPTQGIEVLPPAASDIVSAISDVEPTGETPTGAAIRGACQYAQSWKASHLGHNVAVLLVTDGEPKAPITSTYSACNPTLTDAVDATADCASALPAVRTYVLGVGPFLQNLNQIAAAGRTEAAYLVEDETSESVLEALNAIRADATVPCELVLPSAPSGELLDYAEVNLLTMDAACTQRTVANVSSPGECGESARGWYYDDANDPSSILLCDTTCADVSVPGAQLLYSIGCQTVVH